MLKDSNVGKQIAALTALFVFSGCAEEESGDLGFRGSDAHVSLTDAGMPADASVETVIEPSHWVFFRVNEDCYAARLSDGLVEKTCEKAHQSPSDDGKTVLCRPVSNLDPLIMYSLEFFEELTRLEKWSGSDNYPPRLSPDGSRMAVAVFDGESLKTNILIVSDTGREIDRQEGVKVVDYPNDDVVVFDNYGGRLWFMGNAPIEIEAEPYFALGPDPVGAVYSKLLSGYAAYYIDAETAESRYLGTGVVGAVWGSRVLLLDNERGGTGRVIDLVDQKYEKSVTLPNLHFDETARRIRFLNKNTLIAEISPYCEGATSTASKRTSAVEIDSNLGVTLAENEQPHVLLLDQAQRFMVTLETDVCGAVTGGATLKPYGETDDAHAIDLAALLSDRRIRGGALSPDGDVLALATSMGLSLLDLKQSPPQVKHLDVSGLGEMPIEFR